MTRQVLTRSPPVKRMQPFLKSEDPKTARRGKKFGEVVGSTAAECAAVCCCCPCSVMELLVLALYKVPTRLCKKAWRRRKLRLLKKNQELLGPTKGGPTREELDADLDRMMGIRDRGGAGDDQEDGCTVGVDFEQKMWEQFYETGFWRSPSQRDRHD